MKPSTTTEFRCVKCAKNLMRQYTISKNFNYRLRTLLFIYLTNACSEEKYSIKINLKYRNKIARIGGSEEHMHATNTPLYNVDNRIYNYTCSIKSLINNIRTMNHTLK